MVAKLRQRAGSAVAAGPLLWRLSHPGVSGNLHHPQFLLGLWWFLVHSLSNVAASCGQRSPLHGFWCFFLSPLVLSETATWKAKCLASGWTGCHLVGRFGPSSSSLPTQERAGSHPRQKQKPSSIPGPSHCTPASLLPGSLLLPFPSQFWVTSFQARYSIKSTHYVCVSVQECEIILPLSIPFLTFFLFLDLNLFCFNKFKKNYLFPFGCCLQALSSCREWGYPSLQCTGSRHAGLQHMSSVVAAHGLS